MQRHRISRKRRRQKEKSYQKADQEYKKKNHTRKLIKKTKSKIIQESWSRRQTEKSYKKADQEDKQKSYKKTDQEEPMNERWLLTLTWSSFDQKSKENILQAKYSKI